MDKKVLCVYTKYYPYSKYEVHVENEIKVLSSYFDEIYVFPGFKDSFERKLPENVYLKDDFILPLSRKFGFSKFCRAFIITFSDLFKPRFFNRVKNFKSDIFLLYSKFKEAEKLNDLLKKYNLKDSQHYSVWMNDWSVVLSILKSQNNINSFFCRAHGYDMFHHRYKGDYVPFQGMVMKNSKFIASVSKAGFNYLNDHYPYFESKIKLFPLGVFYYGTNNFSNEMIRFVTACNVNEVKRVHLIVKALKMTKCNIEWVHFGEGPLFGELKDSIDSLPKNVSVILNGRVTTNELFKYYTAVSINAFILVSSTEGGIPIAIQEAMSFGIPVIATRVGGIPEIVNDSNGILLDIDFDIKDLSVLLDNPRNFIFNEKIRENAKQTWATNFDAEKNYGKFAKFILDK